MHRISVQELLEIARARPGMFPRAVAFEVLCASVARAAEQRASLRPKLVVLDAEEGLLLDLSALPSSVGAVDAGYVAPEALIGKADPDDPRVLVYAAGAFGYHLLTGEVPQGSPDRSRAELGSPLGQVVAAALSPDPAGRIPGLDEMSSALHALHPSLSPAAERHLFAAILDCCSRWTDQGTAVQLALIGSDMKGAAEKLSADLVLRWMREVDGLLERQQRRQIELLLASGSEGGSGPLASAPDASVRAREQMELLQRVATLAAPAAPRARGSGWARWAGPIGASAAVAFVIAHGPDPILRLFSAPVATASADPVPRPAAAGERAGPERRVVESPIVLSGSGPEEAADVSVPQGTRGPIPPRTGPRIPKLVSARAPATTDDLIANGDRAMREGRAAEALAAFSAALEIDRGLAQAVRGLGLTYLLQGREREGKEQLERYLEMAPGAEDEPRVRALVGSLRVPDKAK